MDKDYMQFLVVKRIEVLKRKVVEYSRRVEYGKANTFSIYLANARKELRLCVLLELLLSTSSMVYLDNLEAIKGFNQLVNPCERRKKSSEPREGQS